MVLGEGVRQGGRKGNQESKKRETKTGREGSSTCWRFMVRAKWSGQVSKQQHVITKLDLSS